MNLLQRWHLLCCIIEKYNAFNSRKCCGFIHESLGLSCIFLASKTETKIQPFIGMKMTRLSTKCHYKYKICLCSFIDLLTFCVLVPTGSPSRGGDVADYVFDINQPSLPAPFYSVLVSVSVFMALSTGFHSINSPDNSPLSHSVLLVSFLPYWSFQLYVSL